MVENTLSLGHWVTRVQSRLFRYIRTSRTPINRQNFRQSWYDFQYEGHRLEPMSYLWNSTESSSGVGYHGTLCQYIVRGSSSATNDGGQFILCPTTEQRAESSTSMATSRAKVLHSRNTISDLAQWSSAVYWHFEATCSSRRGVCSVAECLVASVNVAFQTKEFSPWSHNVALGSSSSTSGCGPFKVRSMHEKY